MGHVCEPMRVSGLEEGVMGRAVRVSMRTFKGGASASLCVMCVREAVYSTLVLVACTCCVVIIK